MARQWKVKFRHKQEQCCPKVTYYRVEEIVMLAESEQQARDQVIEAWSLDGEVEIKSVEELGNN